MNKTQHKAATAVVADKMAGLEHKIRVLSRLRDVFAERSREPMSLADLLEDD
jgi:hypothetical protein